MIRFDRNSDFREKIFKRFNNKCCFVDEHNEGCKNTAEDTKLRIYRKDGNINNNDDDNILLLCSYHYGVVYYRKTKEKMKEMKKRGIRKEVKKIHVISEEDFDKFKTSIKNPKHLLMFLLFYYSGGRVNEIIHLRKKDVDVNKAVITFIAAHSKRKTERDVDIPTILISPLKSYFRDMKIGSDERLFPITKQRVWQITKEYAKIAKLQNVHPHVFRHSYATKIYNTTGDLKLVQELLGHKNMSTTAIYAHVNKEYRRKSINEVFKT